VELQARLYFRFLFNWPIFWNYSRLLQVSQKSKTFGNCWNQFYTKTEKYINICTMYIC